jgi:Spy/CpxP family protein refolding chaperone
MTEFFTLVSLARRTLLLAGVLIASCCALSAQPDGSMGPPPDGPPPGGMQANMQEQLRGPGVERQLKRLTQLLTLSQVQQAQVKAILTDQRQQVEALFNPAKAAAETGSASSAASDKTASSAASSATSGEDQPFDREAIETLRAAVKSIHEETRTKIAALLTDSQKATYAAWETKREKAAARDQSEDMPPPPDGGDGPPPDGGGGPGGGGPPGGGPPGV